MSSSSSSKKNYTTTYTTTVSKPMTLQDVEGVVVSDVSNSSILLNEGVNAQSGSVVNITDGDSVKQALLFAQNAADRALDFAYDAGRPEADITKNQIWALAAIAAAVFVAPKLMKG